MAPPTGKKDTPVTGKRAEDVGGFIDEQLLIPERIKSITITPEDAKGEKWTVDIKFKK